MHARRAREMPGGASASVRNDKNTGFGAVKAWPCPALDGWIAPCMHAYTAWHALMGSQRRLIDQARREHVLVGKWERGLA